MANIIRKVVTHHYSISNSWLQTKHTFAVLSCGHLAHVCSDKHDISGMATEYPCETCGDVEAKRRELLEVKATKEIMYTRSSKPVSCNNDTCYIKVYGRDRKSPTGVILVASYPDIPELADIFTGGLSPLSPTERY